jgi:hypothetical protein
MIAMAVPVTASEEEEPLPPGPPMALRAWAGENSTALAWEPPATEPVAPSDFFNVYAIDPTGRVELLGSTPDLGFDIQNDPSQIVMYVVTAVNGTGEGPPSNPAWLLGDDYPHCNPIDLHEFPHVFVQCFFPPPQIPPS